MNDVSSSSHSEKSAKHEGMHVPKLETLNSLQDYFQLGIFVSAVQSGAVKPSDYVLLHGGQDGGPTHQQFTVDDMLLYSPDSIPTSLLSLSDDNVVRAVKLFKLIQNEIETGTNGLMDHESVKTAQRMLHQGLKRTELRDEMYMQLLKQTRGNPTMNSKMKAWKLLHAMAASMPPSKKFASLVQEYVEVTSRSDETEPLVKQMAHRLWSSLKRTLAAGARKTLPSTEEIQCLFLGRALTCTISFLDGTFEEINFDMSMTMGDGIKQLASIIKLKNHGTFALFECRRMAKSGSPDVVEEHILLDSKAHIADELTRMKTSKRAKDGIDSKLLIKKRIFQKTDEVISEPQFVNLCYIQAQYDYMQGHVPVARKELAQLCALELHVDHGNALMHNDDDFAKAVVQYLPRQYVNMRRQDEWMDDMKRRYRSLERFTQEAARLHFLKIHRTLPYGQSTFFNVVTMEDPLKMLPREVLMGVNRRGLHFLKQSPTEYLYSVEIRDLMQFGSNTRAVFFKFRVMGALHIFQFATAQAEEMCLALQTHINGIMSGWSLKNQPAGQASSGASSSTAQPTSAEAGPKTSTPGSDQAEQVKVMEKTLAEKTTRIAELEKTADELKAEKERIAEELIAAQAQVKGEEDQLNALHETVGNLKHEEETLLKKIDDAKDAVVEAEANKAAAVEAARQAADEEMIKRMEERLDNTTTKLQSTRETVQRLETRYDAVIKEKQHMEETITQLEQCRAAETQELRDQIKTATGVATDQLRVTESRISELMSNLAKITEAYNANKIELEEMKTELSELDDLRQMKEDVERREKVNQKVIADQAKKLEELEKVHKEEQMLRKKYMSMLEDMQGKVRVYVRLNSEPSGENALEVADEYTVVTKDINREEYAFDQAYNSTDDNAKVFEGVKQVTARCIEGYNVCVVAYGVSGSGKSHTLLGNNGDEGMIVRSVNDLFTATRKKAKKWDFQIKAGIVELVGSDRLIDLLTPVQKKLVVKKDAKGLVHVVNTFFVELESSEAFKGLLQEGLGKRAENGHLLVTITVEAANRETGVVNNGRIVFSDLKGSDNGDESLEALPDVVRALESDETVIPYTRSLVTRTLSDCFGGNAKTLFFIHVAGDSNRLVNTKKDLEMGLAVRKVTNDIEKGELTKDGVKLKKQIDAMKAEAGIPTELLDAVDMVDIVDSRTPSTDAGHAVNT